MSADYRKRFYEAYATNATVEYAYSIEEYELFSKANERRYAAFLPGDRKARILEIACGVGHFLYYVQRKAGYVNAEGIDISEEQLKIASTNGVLNVRLCDCMKYLRDNPNRFDMIVAHHYIEHLDKEEVIDFLEATKASLKIGGRILVTTGNVASLFGASHICADFTHEGGFTPRSMLQILKTMGYQDIEVRGLGPVSYDFMSASRVVLWSILNKILKFYYTVERGRGRMVRNDKPIFEVDLLGTGNRGQ